MSIVLVGVLYLGAVRPLPVRALTMHFPDDGVKVAARPEGEAVVQNTETGESGPSQGAATGGSDTGGRSVVFFDRVEGDASGSLYNVEISGNESRSFRTEGVSGIVNLSMVGLKGYGENGQFELSIDVQGSDDPQVQDESWALRGLYGEFSVENDYSLRLGNVSTSFSSYSLSSSADVGAKYVQQLGDLFGTPFQQLEVYGGRPQRQTGTTFRRYNAGVRLSGEAPRSMFRSYGLNLARTWDDKSSITDPANRPSRAVENYVASVDGDIAITEALSLIGEFAYTRTDTDTLTTTEDEISDWGLQLNANYRFGDWRNIKQGSLRFAYEEVQPDFRSTSGGGSPDQRRYSGYFSGTYDSSIWKLPAIDLGYSYEHNEDNLDGQLARTTETQNHNFSAGFRPYQRFSVEGDGWYAQIRRNLSADFSLRYHSVQTSDTTTDRSTTNQDFQLSTEFNNQTMTGFYRYRINLDKTAGGTDRRQRNYGISYEYDDFVVPVQPVNNPTDFDVSVERTEDWEKNGSGGSDATRWTTGLVHEISDRNRLRMDWRQTATDNNGGNNDLVRSGWSVSLVHTQFYNETGQLSFSYNVNETEEDDPTQDFKEEEIRLDAEFSF